MKSLMSTASILITAPVFAGGPAPHGGDIGVAFVGNKIVTSIVEEDGGGHRRGLGTPSRVFESELGTVEFGPFGNDEPGYTSNVLPAGASIGFNILDELKVWNGAGFDGGIGETMQLARFLGTPGEISRATASGFVSGFLFATADANGFIDEHLSHMLRGPDVLRGFADPADGIYLLELELFTDGPGIANSDPYWIVFNLNMDEATHEAAVGFVHDVLVPGPGGLAMMLPLMPARRRREGSSVAN